MSTTKTAPAAPAVATPAPRPSIDWSNVSLPAAVVTSVQPAKRKKAEDIPAPIRELVDRLKASVGTILAVTFPTEAHAKQARTLINQYARLTEVDPAPQTFLQEDKVTLHVRVPVIKAKADDAAPAAS